MTDIFRKALEIKEYLTWIRRHLHEYPELGMQEYETTALVKKELEKMGVEVVPIASEVGVLGIIKGEKEGEGRVTALRADMDALPIQENTGLPYASKNPGVMHACGHEGHTTSVLGAAKLLSSMRDQFSGTVKFIFQPGEETLTGAKAMIKAGVLENPKVDNIICLHTWPNLDVGKIGYWPGYYHASADKFEIRIFGGGGHGGYPHKANDTVLAASHAVVALQSIVSRQAPATDSLVVSVCTFHGGNAFNVMPEEVKLSGTVRCHNAELRLTIPDRMDKILKGITEAFNCKYELDYTMGVPSVYNDPGITEKIKEAAEQVLGEGAAELLPGPVMGGEDFSLYLEQVPQGAFFRLGNHIPGGEELAVHNERFNFNDDSLPVGVAVLTQYVLNMNK
jgi:amidohydrolase